MPTKEVEVRFKFSGDMGRLQEVLDKLDGAQVRITGAGKSSEEAAGKFSLLSSAVKELAAQFLTLEGSKKVLEYFWAGMKDAAQEAREMRGIGAVLKDIGADAEKGKAQIEAFANRMKDAGFTDEQTRASLMQLLPVTRDLDASIGLLNVAYGLNITRGKDVGQTLELMSRLLIGNPRALIEAQIHYGVVLDQTLPKAEQFKDAMRQLVEQGAGVADKTRDATARIASLGIIMGDIQKGVGARFLEQINAIGGGFGWTTQRVVDFGTEIVSALGRASVALTTFGQSEILMWIMGKKKPEAAPSGAPGTMSGHGKDSWLAGLLNFRTQAGDGAPGAGSAETAAAKAAQDLANAMRDLRAAETVEAATAFDNAEGKKAMADAARRLIAALDAEKQAAKGALEVERAQKIKDAKGDAAAILDINKTYDAKQLALDVQYQGKLDALDRTHLKRIADIEASITGIKRKNEELRTTEAREQAEKRVQFEKEQREKIDAWNKVRLSTERSLYNQLIGLAGQYGGKSLQTVVQVAQGIQQLYDLWQTIQTIFFAKKQVEEATAAITSQVTAKTTGVVNATAGAYEYAINAAASVAAIPFAGWAMAPGVYAEALATGLLGAAAIAALPVAAAAGGGLFGRPTVTLLGEAGQEMVLPEKLTRVILGMATVYDRTNGGTVNNVNNSRHRGGDVYVTQHLLTGAHADYAFRQLDRKLVAARRQNNRAMASPRRTRVGSARRVN